jgi:ATPase subunit of ABC transporter with duplicated ATPase domains
MITVNNLKLSYGERVLFSDVNLQFTPGNCYGVIGANGAGKSTFLKILSGETEASSGTVELAAGLRMSVLKQNQNAYDDYPVLEAVVRGNARLYEIMQAKDALYAKTDFSEEDGIRASELEGEFAEMNGWEAEADASRLLQGLGLDADCLTERMATLDGRLKVKVLLAQALFGQPDVILLDEPTNNLDVESIGWLEDFLLDYPGTVILVSHDRHFLNMVCTHIADIDFGKMNLYVGNYDFWYESSQLMQQMIKDQNKKKEEKAKELKAFIARFSANKSKSRQATSRKKLLDKLEIEELPASSRRYPWIHFQPEREVGNEILTVEHLTKSLEGTLLFRDVSFRLNKYDKVALVGDNEQANTALIKILTGEMEADSGSCKWGISTTQSYFPKDNTAFFDGRGDRLLDWLRRYAADLYESDLRGFLGRMLFSGDEVLKSVNVLSGGERVRCMLARMMLSSANVLLLDQPTNHLDLESITALNQALQEFKGNIIFSTHDRELMQTTANRVLELSPQGVWDRMMTYDDYLEARRREAV